MTLTPSSTRTTSIPSRLSSLAPWVDATVFGPAEVHAAEVLTRSEPSAGPMVQLAAACALWAPLHGHACVDLERVAEMVVAELAAGRARTNAQEHHRTSSDGAMADDADRVPSLPWPAPRTWADELRASRLVREVGAADATPVYDDRPLVLHGMLLYTQRQWIDEGVVAALLSRRAAATDDAAALTPAGETLLERLLPAIDEGTENRQHVAARAMLTARLTVIVGGPGTGKTHTVARALAVMATEADQAGRHLRIGLAAPTGKAAARMQEAIGSAVSNGITAGHLAPEPAAVLADLTTSTIHRMLGWRGATRFAHDADTPLPFDVVVVDEASMVALPLMARLLEAIPPAARLVLVGDPDQLHSIEVGAVLADVVTAAAHADSPLHRRVVRLQRSRRQQHGSPIGPLADAVRTNRADDALALLRSAGHGTTDDQGAAGGHPRLTFIESADPIASTDGAGVRDVVLAPLLAAAHAARAGAAHDALRHFATVRVLCAHRTGRHGVDPWNRTIESWLFDELGVAGPGRAGRFYPGRPLLATRNDRRQRVANGDTGIVIADPAGVRAAFGTADGLRVLAPAQLERVETAYATTIHKSQGSEYHTVVVVLPPASSPLVGRELLYTAITRATERLVVVGTESALVACISTPSRRVTGLAAALAP